MPKVLDLDNFAEEENVLKFGGKEFVFKIVPFAVALKFYETLPVFQKIENEGQLKHEDFEQIVPLITELLTIVDKTVDENFVKRNLDIKRFQPLVGFMFDLMFGESKKNSADGDDLGTST